MATKVNFTYKWRSRNWKNDIDRHGQLLLNQSYEKITDFDIDIEKQH